MKKNIQLIIILLMIVSIFIYHDNVTNSIKNATILFQNKIFPSLFPFIILSPFLINYGFLNVVKRLIGPLTKKLFNLSATASYVFIMSLLSGFPGSAIYAKELYDKNIITKKEIEHLILFCHFSNPIFIMTMITDKPFLILAVHYLLSIFIGILLKNKDTVHKANPSIIQEPNSFFKIFTSAIKNGMDNALFILGVIVFFFMISSIINHPITNIFLEVSQGLNYIKELNISNQLKAAISGSLLSFGGLSVHLQTYGIVSNLDFNYLKYLKTRLLHALLSFTIIFLLY